MRYAAAAALAVAVLLAGCTSDTDQPDGSPSAAPDPAPEQAAQGYSTPVEDSVYPQVGDPGVDALHYWLTLDWDPDTRALDAVERLRLRSTSDAEELRLDLGRPLQPSSLTLDGEPAPYRHEGKDLVVEHPVTEDSEHTLVLRYAGRPRPVPAPVQRSDFSETGWTVTRGGHVWTMQEPYGAYTWYAVNDQPSDKALYDVTIAAPSPMVGVSNGTPLSRRTRDGGTVTHWRLDEPASSYLVTVAIGDFTVGHGRSPSGVPISFWTPRGRSDLARRLHAAPAGMAWLESKLGPFPFDRLGFLVVDSESGMETQTMITLGDTRYATSPAVLVHEMAHQWYGDEVTPTDWRDVWMNEGMATFLQGMWTSEHGGPSVDKLFGEWASYDQQLRSQAGPPADYDPDSFGSGNVYYIPAVMWNELRKKLGDDLFWRLVREWPTVHADGNADYDDITSWWSEQSGQDLQEFFDTWLRSSDSPS